jgi:glycosyltransferase involved in cell wall biosynthesis
MPAYNEAENIRSVVREWYPVLELAGDNSRLVVADSGSTDETDKVLEEMCNEYPKLLILKDTLKQHGPKLIALYKYAITNGADYIFQTDSDGQTLPSEFTQMWNKRNKRDALIGHRIKRGDGASRAFVEKVVCFLLRLYYGVRVPDANAPFRLMRAELVSKYIDRFDEDYNLPNIMLTTFFAYYKENIEFCPITFQNRQGGVNSINIAKIIKIGWRALSDFREFKRGM